MVIPKTKALNTYAIGRHKKGAITNMLKRTLMAAVLSPLLEPNSSVNSSLYRYSWKQPPYIPPYIVNARFLLYWNLNGFGTRFCTSSSSKCFPLFSAFWAMISATKLFKAAKGVCYWVGFMDAGNTKIPLDGEVSESWMHATISASKHTRSVANAVLTHKECSYISMVIEKRANGFK